MDDESLSIRSYVSIISFFFAIFFCVRPLIIRIPSFIARFLPISHLKLDLASAPVLCILFQLATTVIKPDVVQRGFLGTAGIQPYGIMVLFFSLAYVSISIDLTGLFGYIAFQVTKRGKGDGMRLFNYLFVLSVILTIFTSNDVVVLTVTPILCYLGKVSKIDVSAFTLSSFIVCNIASMMLYIGNPTNVVVAQASSITFIEFTAWMGVPTIVGILCAYFGTRLLVNGFLPRSINPPSLEAEKQYALNDRAGAIFGVTILLSCLVCLMVVPLFKDVGVWLLTGPFGLCLLAKDFISDLYRGRNGRHTVYNNEKLSLNKLPPFQSDELRSLDLTVKDEEEIPTTNGISSHTRTQLYDTGYLNDNQFIERTNEITSNDDGNEVRGKLDLDPASPLLTDTMPTVNVAKKGSHQIDSRNDVSISNNEINDGNLDSESSLSQTRKNSISVTKIERRLPVTYTALCRCPWRIGPFAIGMFILVESLNSLNWTTVFASAISHLCPTVPAAIFGIGFLSAIACSLLNNLPMTILAIRVIQHPNFLTGIGGDVRRQQNLYQGALWALVIGSNIGADLTFVASLAGLMWSQLLKMHEGMEMKELRFAKLCVGVMILSLVGSLGTLVLEFAVMGRL